MFLFDVILKNEVVDCQTKLKITTSIYREYSWPTALPNLQKYKLEQKDLRGSTCFTVTIKM